MMERVRARQFALQRAVIPPDGVEMHTGQARLFDAAAHLFQRPRQFALPAERFGQGVELVDGEERQAVHAEIIFAGEVALDDQVGDAVERRCTDFARIMQIRRSPHFLRKNIDPVVVGPHQGEGHALWIRRTKESLVERAGKKRAVFVVIPVEEEVADPVAGRGGDFALHDLRIGLVLVTPDRHQRLAMSRITRHPALEEIPLGPAPPVFRLIARIRVVIREVEGADRRVRCGAGLGEGV